MGRVVESRCPRGDSCRTAADAARVEHPGTLRRVVPQYTPMTPTLVREPFHRDGWVYEEKVDGWRILAYKDGARVHLVSRNGRDHTRRFRDIAAAISKLSARSLVLDGEVAIYDQQLRSRFDWLREPDPNAVASPPLSIVFDLLYQDPATRWDGGSVTAARPAGGRRGRQRPGLPGAPAGAGRPGGMEAGGRARVPGLRRQGRGEPVRKRVDEPPTGLGSAITQVR
jgi:ATP dependent DNA ligase domain